MQLGEIHRGVGAGRYGMLLFVGFRFSSPGLMSRPHQEYVARRSKHGAKSRWRCSRSWLLQLMLSWLDAIAVVFPPGPWTRWANAGPARFNRGVVCHTSQTGTMLGVRRHSGYPILQHHRRFVSAMFVGPSLIIPAMAIAGSLPRKNASRIDGTFRPTGGLFGGIVCGRNSDNRLGLGGEKKKKTFFPRRSRWARSSSTSDERQTPYSDRSHLGGTFMDTLEAAKRGARYRPCWIRRCVPDIGSAFVKLDPRLMIKNP